MEALSTDGFDDPPPDFLTHLERRLGISRDAAMAILAEWLLTYEPVGRPRRAHSACEPARQRGAEVRKARALAGAEDRDGARLDPVTPGYRQGSISSRSSSAASGADGAGGVAGSPRRLRA